MRRIKLRNSIVMLCLNQLNGSINVRRIRLLSKYRTTAVPDSTQWEQQHAPHQTTEKYCTTAVPEPTQRESRAFPNHLPKTKNT